VGLLSAAYALGQVGGAPVVGRLSDRCGRKPLLLLSVGGTFLSLLLLGFSWALYVLFISRLLDGLTWGNITVAQAYITDSTPPEERAKRFGLMGGP
jgi:MFS transporter, DHA1 family, tetracycline resistance protein